MVKKVRYCRTAAAESVCPAIKVVLLQLKIIPFPSVSHAAPPPVFRMKPARAMNGHRQEPLRCLGSKDSRLVLAPWIERMKFLDVRPGVAADEVMLSFPAEWPTNPGIGIIAECGRLNL